MSQETIVSVVKTFEIIKTMSRQSKWGLTDLCRATGFPKSTVFRVMLTLEELGIVVQEHKGGTYQLTLELFKISSNVVSQFDLVEQGRPTCRALLQSINETVNLAVPSDLDMLVVDRHVTSQLLRPESVVGTAFPMYPSACGEAYLAFLPEDECDELLKRIISETVDVTEKDIDDFKSELDTVRRDGFACDREEIYSGVRCIAAPVFNHAGEVIATLSCSIPSMRMNDISEQLFFNAVVKHSIQLSRTLRAPESILTPGF